MLTIPKARRGNTGTSNGNFKTGLNSFRLAHIDDLLGTKYLKILKDRILQSTKKQTNGCWNWGGAVDQVGGYGTMMVGNRPHMVHRLSWISHKRSSIKAQCILHRCDNPLCVNPNHLFIGTRADNNHDRNEKGRQVKGSNVNTAILNEAKVRLIKEELSKKKKQRSLASAFGVKLQVIERISRGLTWKHV